MSKRAFSEKGRKPDLEYQYSKIEEEGKEEEEEENSPIPEVAAVVSNKDDPKTPVLTFRFWLMAVAFAIFLSFFNQFL
jgi:hypothetical protein